MTNSYFKREGRVSLVFYVNLNMELHASGQVDLQVSVMLATDFG